MLAGDVEISTVTRGDKLTGGAAGEVFPIVLTYSGGAGSGSEPSSESAPDKGGAGAPASLIVKATSADGLTHCAREPAFVRLFSADRDFGMVRCVWAGGSDAEGNVLVMEDLRGVATRCDQYLGGQGGESLQEAEGQQPELDRMPSMSPELMWRRAFEAAAETHARYWGGAALRADGARKAMLKGADWLEGSNRAGWESSINTIRRAWRLADTGCMTERARSFIARSLDEATFDGAVAAMNARNVTLCHGDFHAKNLFWHHERGALVSTDFSEVGLADPMSDLCQFILSDVDADTRRAHERSVLRAYWDRLVACGVDATAFSWETCWAQYRSGIDRWLWFIPVLLLWKYRPQYFADQIDAWLSDHEPRAFVPMRWCVDVRDSLVPAEP